MKATNLYQGELKVEKGGGEAAKDTHSALLAPSPFSLEWVLFAVDL